MAELPKERFVERAADLLMDTGGRVSAIAAKVGWLEHTHFDRAFRNHFGCSPSDFRRNSSE